MENSTIHASYSGMQIIDSPETSHLNTLAALFEIEVDRIYYPGYYAEMCISDPWKIEFEFMEFAGLFNK